MTGTPWELKAPQIVGTSAHVILCDRHSDGRAGIHLTGKMNDWVQPKDLILHLAGKLTVKVRLYHTSSVSFSSYFALIQAYREALAAFLNTMGQVFSTNHVLALLPLRTWEPRSVQRHPRSHTHQVCAHICMRRHAGQSPLQQTRLRLGASCPRTRALNTTNTSRS